MAVVELGLPCRPPKEGITKPTVRTIKAEEARSQHVAGKSKEIRHLKRMQEEIITSILARMSIRKKYVLANLCMVVSTTTGNLPRATLALSPLLNVMPGKSEELLLRLSNLMSLTQQESMEEFKT